MDALQLFEKFPFQRALSELPQFSGSIALAQEREPCFHPVTGKEDLTYLWKDPTWSPKVA